MRDNKTLIMNIEIKNRKRRQKKLVSQAPRKKFLKNQAKQRKMRLIIKKVKKRTIQKIKNQIKQKVKGKQLFRKAKVKRRNRMIVTTDKCG